ncbi:MAG: type II secretion system protein [Phycisphaerales bacterium]
MIELLVVIGVVVTLLGILVVAVGSAAKTAQKANTRALMNSMKVALHQFRTDIGYLPPILGEVKVHPFTGPTDPLRGLFDPRGSDGVWNGDGEEIFPESPTGGTNSSYSVNIQEWYSLTTLAEYLLGYGGRDQDGYGVDALGNFGEEQPALGFRHPSPDGVWGATIGGASGGLDDRMRATAGSQFDVNLVAGKVYGPYLELKDPNLLASYDGNNVNYPGDAGYLPGDPKVIVDYWGRPIRYYRRLYSPGALNSPFRTFGGTRPPTLSDVFVLRPFEIDPGSAIDGIGDMSEASYLAGTGDTSTTVALNSAEFALLSSGPDGRLNQDIRFDSPDDSGNQPFGGPATTFANEDNIVELGP